MSVKFNRHNSPSQQSISSHTKQLCFFFWIIAQRKQCDGETYQKWKRICQYVVKSINFRFNVNKVRKHVFNSLTCSHTEHNILVQSNHTLSLIWLTVAYNWRICVFRLRHTYCVCERRISSRMYTKCKGSKQSYCNHNIFHLQILTKRKPINEL